MKLLLLTLLLPSSLWATEWRDTEAKPVNGTNCGYGQLSHKAYGDGLSHTAFIYPKKEGYIVDKHLVLKVSDELFAELRAYTRAKACLCLDVAENEGVAYVNKYTATSEPRPCPRRR